MSASAPTSRKTVAVVITVKNDPVGCEVTLRSLAAQTRPADEIIVVDGGADDDTAATVRRFRSLCPQLRLIEAPGANIACGRNTGIQAARSDIIATTDAGCRAESDWLAALVRPLEQDAEAEFVAGFYRIDPQTLFEHAVGLATMRGQLDPVNPETFNPSARSMAYTKALWHRVGGLPQWLCYSEDTLFDHKVRAMRVGWRFAGDAIVHWRPRSTLRSVARQFYGYGTGRGHTQIGAADFAYNLRNMLLVAALIGLSIAIPWAVASLILLAGYFYVWTFHPKAARIARRTQSWRAYPLCVFILCVVLFSNTAGYVVGSFQRWRNQRAYQQQMKAYLAK